MRLTLTLILLSIFTVANGSNWLDQNGESMFSAGKINVITSDSAIQAESMALLSKKIAQLEGSSDAVLYDMKRSPVGFHLSYYQSYAGTEIFGTNIKLNLAKNGDVLSVFYKLLPSHAFPEASHNTEADAKKILKLTNNNYLFTTKKVWFYNDETLIPAFYIVTDGAGLNAHHEMVCDTAYHVLYTKDKTLNFGPDSLVKAYVFMPDPLTSAQKEYKSPYINNDDQDAKELDDQRLLVNIRTEYFMDSFYLSGPYAKIAEYVPPITSPTYSKNGFFDFTRSQSGFEDVNSFYHVSNFQNYVQYLGFDSMGNFPIKIDAHAGSADQSSFEFSGGDPRLYFGLGGIDDAEDADVIVHEYGHFLSWCATGDNVSGKERETLEEAMCDYLACSYSRAYSEYNWEKVFNWDGNETWKGRSCVCSRHYPEDITHNIYTDAEIWAGAFMDVWEFAGAERIDRSMLGSFYTFGKYISLEDAAKSFMQIDSILHPNADDGWKIRLTLYNRGLLPKSYATVEDEKEGFLKSNIKYYGFNAGNSLILEFTTRQQGSMSLLNIEGKQLLHKDFNTNRLELNLNQPLAPGVYLLNVSTAGDKQTFKLVKNN